MKQFLKRFQGKIFQVFLAASQWLRCFCVSPKSLQENVSPVFIIGANRSGTSIVSSLLSQHPEVEGLFSGHEAPTYNQQGHSIGYCESMHVWSFLKINDSQRQKHNDLPYWGLPQYLSGNYRHRVKNRRERVRLALAVGDLRKTDRSPLIKDQFNTLRVGLIHEVFPKARFILVSRKWDHFLERSFHKWKHEGVNIYKNAERPKAGMHWHLVNMVARYDLKSFASGRHTETWLENFQHCSLCAIKALDKIVQDLGLSSHNFDLKLLENSWKKEGKGPCEPLEKPDFESIKKIVDYEKTLTTPSHVA